MERWKKALKRPVTLIALATVLLVLILAGSLMVAGRDKAADDSVSGNAVAKSDVKENGIPGENAWNDDAPIEEMASNKMLDDNIGQINEDVDDTFWEFMTEDGNANQISFVDEHMLFPESTLQVGYLMGNCLDITLEAGEKISDAVAKMEADYRADPPADVPVVKPRDWGIYSSSLAKEGLSSRQAAFYDRLDAMCRLYIQDAALDGVENKRYECYTTDAVPYSDLGLEGTEAYDILWWFKYNNPQYYFLEGWGLRTSDALYPYLYDFAADGVKRVEITNELFDKLDQWIEAVNDDEITSWQKELSANNLLCKKIVYNEEYMGNFRIDQSLYSAVVMESTVCSGYAGAFCAMMNASGIDTVVALSPVHAWNVVCFDDGQHYAVDVTWNDNENNDDAPYNRYLNVGEISLKEHDDEMDHTYCAEYVTWIPEIGREDYVPTDYDRTGLAQDENKVSLQVPENLQVVSHEDGKVAVTCDLVENATRYAFEIYSGDDGSFLAGPVLSFPLVSVEYGKYPSLEIRVRAEAVLDGIVYQSDWSEALYIDTNAEQDPDISSSEEEKPEAPGNVQITESTETTIYFSWDKVEGAEQYQVVLFRDAEYTQSWVGTYVTETSAGFIKLQPGTMYYYGIRTMQIVDGEEIYSDWNYFSHKTDG